MLTNLFLSSIFLIISPLPDALMTNAKLGFTISLVFLFPSHPLILDVWIAPPMSFAVRPNGMPVFSGKDLSYPDDLNIIECNDTICSTPIHLYVDNAAQYNLEDCKMLGGSVYGLYGGFMLLSKTQGQNTNYEVQPWRITPTPNPTWPPIPAQSLQYAIHPGDFRPGSGASAQNPTDNTFWSVLFDQDSAANKLRVFQDNTIEKNSINNQYAVSTDIDFHPITERPWFAFFDSNTVQLVLYECLDANCNTADTHNVLSDVDFSAMKFKFDQFGNPKFIYIRFTTFTYVNCHDQYCTSFDRVFVSTDANASKPIFFSKDPFVVYHDSVGAVNWDTTPLGLCAPGEKVDVTIYPPKCAACSAPGDTFAYNPWYNGNTTCDFISFPTCSPGYHIVNATGLPYCDVCSTSPSLSQSYNPIGVNSQTCSLVGESNCPAGRYADWDIPDSLTVCKDCSDATSVGSYNPSPNRDASCSFVPHSDCTSNNYLLLSGLTASCQNCPNATLDGTYNPNPNLELSCSFTPKSNCSSFTFVQLDGIDSSCQACPANTSEGSFNPWSNKAGNCTFVYFIESCGDGFFFNPENGLCEETGTQIEEDEETKKKNQQNEENSSGLLYGGAGVAGVTLLFVGHRWKKKKKSTYSVVYRGSSTIGGSFHQSGSTMNLLASGSLQAENGVIHCLSLDGGGIRGLFIVDILQEIGKQTLISPSKLFHMIGGTSTGGLLALGLARLGATIDEARDLYFTLGTKVFATGTRGKWGRLWKQLSGSAFYDSQIFEEILRNVFGKKPLFFTPEDPEFPLAFGVSTLTSEDPPVEYIFRTYPSPDERAYKGPESSDQMLLWEAARATSAAPLFFEEFVRGEQTFADGALYHNNPARVVLRESKYIWPESVVGLLVSCGTGVVPVSFSSSSKSGISWAKTLASIVTNSERSHTEILAEFPSNLYYRFNPEIPKQIPIDSCDQCDLDEIKMLSDAYLSKIDTLDRICDLKDQIYRNWTHLSPSLGPLSIVAHLEPKTKFTNTMEVVSEVEPLSEAELAELDSLRHSLPSLQQQLDELKGLVSQRGIALTRTRSSISMSSRGSSSNRILGRTSSVISTGSQASNAPLLSHH